MYAIVKAGGRQVKAEPRKTVKIDRLKQTVGDGVEFTEVLAVHNGTALTVGSPYVESAKVIGRVVRQGKDRKITVRTFRRKKRTRRHLGHRQPHTLVEILEIEAEQVAGLAPVEEPVGEPVDGVDDEEDEGDEDDE